MKQNTSNIYGVKMRNTHTGKVFEVWYDQPEDRERFLRTLERDKSFELMELCDEQLDTNRGKKG